MTSIEADFASIEHPTDVRASTFMVQVVSLYVAKNVFYCIFRQCRPGVLLQDAAKQLKMGSGCMIVFPADPKYRRLWAAKVRLTRAINVRSDVFFGAVHAANTSSRRAFGIHHTFDMKRKVILKLDAIPTVFSEWEVKDGT